MLARGHRGDAEGLLRHRARWPQVCRRGWGLAAPQVVVRCRRRRLAVGIMTPVTHIRGHHDMRLGEQGRGKTEALGHVHRLLVVEVDASAGGLARAHVPVVDVRLQVALGQVGAFAALHNAAHVQRAAQALFDPLHRVCAAVYGQTETKETLVMGRGGRESNTTQHICWWHLCVIIQQRIPPIARGAARHNTIVLMY